MPAWAEVSYTDPFGWDLISDSGSIQSWYDPNFGAANPGSYTTETNDQGNSITYYTGSNNGTITFETHANGNPSGYDIFNNSTSSTMPQAQIDLGDSAFSADSVTNGAASIHAENTGNNKIYVNAHNASNVNTSVYIKQNGYQDFVHGNWYLLDVEYIETEPSHQLGDDVNSNSDWNLDVGTHNHMTIAASSVQTGVPSGTLDAEIVGLGGSTAYGVYHYGNTTSNGGTFDNYPLGFYGQVSGHNSTANTKSFRCSPTITAGVAGGEYWTAGRKVARAIFQYDSAAHTSGAYNDDDLSILCYGSRGLIDRIDVLDITSQVTDGDFFDFSTPASNYKVLHSMTNIITTEEDGDGYQYMSPKLYYKENSCNFHCIPNNEFETNFSRGNGYYFSQAWQLPQNWDTPVTASGYRFVFTVEQNSDYPGSLQGALKGYVAAKNVSGTFYGFGFENLTEEGTYVVNGNFDNIENVTILRFDSNGSQLLTTAIASTTTTLLNDSTGTTDDGKVTFYPDSVNGFVGRINNISLTDATQYYTGNSVDSWSFGGFDVGLNNYIQFSEAEEAIVFVDAPSSNTLSPPDVTGFGGAIGIEQVVGQLVQGDTYVFSFNHTDLTGLIKAYYFNKFGQGFIIDIQNGGTGSFNQLITIGEQTTDGSEGYLVDTLVFYSHTGLVSGSIDNVFLQRQLLDYVSKTVSFSETAQGWTSFKSFIPDNGISISKKYYTMFEAKLYEHNHENALRCNFYENQYSSNVNFIFNAAPDTVKSFRTISYEGTQGKTFVNPSKFNFSTDTDGWAVSNINTDLEKGLVTEFTKKEGKWFGRIQGKNIGDIQYEDFVMQGLGTLLNYNNGPDDNIVIDE